MRFYLIAFLLVFISCKTEKTEKVEIAAAANMQYAIKEIAAAFEEETGTPTSVSIASSGKLTNQIKNGAPYEVFLSADMEYPKELDKKGLSASTPKAYAYGKLVLWTVGEDDPTISLLSEKKIKHIALANPKLAPYGVAAQSVLEEYKLFKKLEDKFVYGESITQVNQFITSYAAEIGFTALSVVRAPNNRDHGKWIEISDSLYEPIGQGAVLLAKEKGVNENAKKFYDFLFAEKSRKILEDYGYSFQD